MSNTTFPLELTVTLTKKTERPHMDIFVSNLPFKLSETELQELFKPYGEVTAAKIIIDHKLRQSKGYGFVTMPDFTQGKAAIKALNGYKLNDRPLKVSISTKAPEADAPDTLKALVPFWKRKIKLKNKFVTFDNEPEAPKKGMHKKRKGHGRGTKY